MKKCSVKKIVVPTGKPLAVCGLGDVLCMLSVTSSKISPKLFISWSKNGLDFVTDQEDVTIRTTHGKSELLKDCVDFSISQTPSTFIMTYTRKIKNGKKVFVVAKSIDLYEWTIKSEIENTEGNFANLVYNKTLDLFHLYTDGLFVRGRSSRTLSFWKEKPTPLFTSRFGMFDDDSLSLIGSLVMNDGIFILYDASTVSHKNTLVQVGGVIIDVHNPHRIIWRSDIPLWQGVVSMKARIQISPLGFVTFKKKFLIYWVASNGDVLVADFPALFQLSEVSHYKILTKFDNNPILSPRHNLLWEKYGTFNPAVFEDNGAIHLLYRALGEDGISRVGYARSYDGLSFDYRSSHPVFEPRTGYGLPLEETAQGPIGFHPAIYTSGGGWGGSEDPRTVKIGNRIYMSYVAFEGWWSIRIAVTSISVSDFRKGKWNWKKPVLISSPHSINKNWLIFPEKIKGKFAVIHSIAPHVMIDYVDSVDEMDGFIESPRREGPQPGRDNFWDSRLRGAGPPPLKTKAGWLLLYHAIDKREPHKYKLGAMMLDLDDPTKVLYRSNHPILYPEMWYENDGKPGVVYASGALIRGDDLYVYYGGGDKVVCVATTNLADFLEYLKTGKPDNYKLNKYSVSVGY